MIETWRWFGPSDPVTLAMARQAGATGVVTALHEAPVGTAWTQHAVAARKAAVAAEGLRWAVVESIPVSDAIKRRDGPWRAHVDAWIASLRALAAEDVRVVCYNMMPVVDWTRTALAAPTLTGATCLRFDAVDLAVFDVHVLRRAEAEADHAPQALAAAEARAAGMDDDARAALEAVVIAGLPGTDIRHNGATFRAELDAYAGVDAAALRANHAAFLADVAPEAERLSMRLAVHPDDPPRPLFGLPRVVSTAADAAAILAAVDTPANGLTLCAGSYGARADNDAPAMARRFAERIWFAHLRNVRREADGSFEESAHLDGDVDMAAVVAALTAEEARRGAAGEAFAAIPMRPDHGHAIGPDAAIGGRPGYPFVGRLRGLAELRGLVAGLAAARTGA